MQKQIVMVVSTRHTKRQDTGGVSGKKHKQIDGSTHTDYDPWTQFLYVPRTVTFLVVGLLALTYFSHPFESSSIQDPLAARKASYENVKHGIWAIVSVFLGYSAVQGTSSPHLVRPHPSFWKLVHGVMICYLSFMVFLLFQTVDDARIFLKVWCMR